MNIVVFGKSYLNILGQHAEFGTSPFTEHMKTHTVHKNRYLYMANYIVGLMGTQKVGTIQVVM